MVVPHSYDVELEDFEIFQNHLALMRRINGLSRISTYSLNKSSSTGGLLGIARQEPILVEFNEESYTLEFREQGDYNSSVLRITYSSLITPDSIFNVDLTTGKLTGRLRLQIPI